MRGLSGRGRQIAGPNGRIYPAKGGPRRGIPGRPGYKRPSNRSGKKCGGKQVFGVACMVLANIVLVVAVRMGIKLFI